MKGSMHLKVHMTFTFSVHSHIRHEITQDTGKATLVKKQGAGSVSALPMCMGSHPHIPSRGKVPSVQEKTLLVQLQWHIPTIPQSTTGV